MKWNVFSILKHYWKLHPFQLRGVATIGSLSAQVMEIGKFKILYCLLIIQSAWRHTWGDWARSPMHECHFLKCAKILAENIVGFARSRSGIGTMCLYMVSHQEPRILIHPTGLTWFVRFLWLFQQTSTSVFENLFLWGFLRYRQGIDGIIFKWRIKAIVLHSAEKLQYHSGLLTQSVWWCFMMWWTQNNIGAW